MKISARRRVGVEQQSVVPPGRHGESEFEMMINDTYLEDANIYIVFTHHRNIAVNAMGMSRCAHTPKDECLWPVVSMLP